MKRICYNTSCSAGVAHPVERHLAKVEVASSSLVTRSINSPSQSARAVIFYIFNPGCTCSSRGLFTGLWKEILAIWDAWGG